MSDRINRLNYITILRAVAILLVLVVHVEQQTSGIEHLHPYIISLLNNGARGVQLFYMLSAFTLFLSFNQRFEKHAISNYFIRRFFRIAPLYYLAIIYYLWQDGLGPRYWLGNTGSITIANIISNITFLHAFNPYWITSLVPGGWSIAVEVVFYCCLPFLFFRIKNLQHAINFMFFSLFFRFLLLLLFTHIRLISDERLWNDYLFLYFPNQLPVFSLGIILYYLLYTKKEIKLSQKSIVVCSIIALIGLAMPNEMIISNLFLYGLGFMLLVIALHKYKNPIFFNSGFMFVGDLSYTIYLTHWAAIHFLNRYKLFNVLTSETEPITLLNYLINYVEVLTISLMLSTILHWIIELPMQKVGKTIIRMRAGIKKVPIAY